MFLIYIIGQLVINNSVSFFEVSIILIITAANIYKEKYYNSILITVIEFVLITLIGKLSPSFIFLYGLVAYDIFYKKLYIGLIPLLIGGLYYLKLDYIPIFLLMVGISSIFGYLRGVLEERERIFLESYDKERRYRYELEEAKAKLMNSSLEVVHVAEIKERNRIAREIHDNVGHSVAGILMQLQASYKLSGKDDKKANELLKKSIDELSNSLTILRDTVHNIKPLESMGIEYIKSVINNFRYCTVDFKCSGDFNNLSANLLQIIHTNIKEALTNISKHSKATRVDITIDINERFVRLFIKDNGVGCGKVMEGLGISGMKERVNNIGGSISISSEDGFLIVCVIPRELKEGVGIFEDSNSR
jgi:signal transduction histidine kinase